VPKAAKMVVDKSDSTLQLLDAQGKVIAQVPVSSGSQHDPLPIGEWKILGVSRPAVPLQPEAVLGCAQGRQEGHAAAGPEQSGRPGLDRLSKPHYGLHGTPEPGHVGKTESHGCVRMTNWDALRVADAVDTSVPVLMQE
jgi:hypothetical protein